MEEETEYRIVQMADHTFVVDRIEEYNYTPWPWSKPETRRHWARVGCGTVARPFPSQDEAQKFIDDRRKYPIVVKHPA